MQNCILPQYSLLSIETLNISNLYDDHFKISYYILRIQLILHFMRIKIEIVNRVAKDRVTSNTLILKNCDKKK